MVKIALAAALLALGVVSAMPVERAAPIPDVINNGGRLSVVGIGAQNSNFNKTATFDGRSGKLTLGSMASGIRVVLVSHNSDYTQSTGYLSVDPEACVTADKATGRTGFYLTNCPTALYPDQEGEAKELRERQLFTFALDGQQLSVVLGDVKEKVPVRPFVRIVGGNEVHTTPSTSEENMQLYLNPYV